MPNWAKINLLHRGVRNSLGGGSAPEPSDDLPAADGWTLNRTYTDGGAAGLDIAAILDIIDAGGREVDAIGFNADGTTAYCGAAGAQGPLASFALSVPFDLSTAVRTGTNCTWGGYSFAYGYLPVSADESRIWGPSYGQDRIWPLTLSTPGEVNTGDAGSPSITDTQMASPDTADASDGTFWSDATNGIYAGMTFEISNVPYVTIGTMDPAGDITSFTAGSHFDLSGQLANIPHNAQSGMMLAVDGLSIYIWDGVAGTLWRWDMSTPWDCSTMSNPTSASYTSVYDLAFIATDASRMFFINRAAGGSHAVYEYLPT